MAYHLTLRSKNSKTGPIPVSISPKWTCPVTCPLRGRGCYSDLSYLGIHWRNVTAGRLGVPWEAFLEGIRSLAPGTLWRHNQAGDLPGVGDRIDRRQLEQLVEANAGKQGFTYTHKPMHIKENQEAVRFANENGFVVNLSANSPQEVSELLQLRVGPVVTLVSREAPPYQAISHFDRVLVCPAQRRNTNCDSCRLCARVERRVAIGFKPHGSRWKRVDNIARHS